MSKINAMRRQGRRNDRICIDLPSDISEHVRERAEAEGRSRDEVILMMAAEALKAEREMRGLS